ncbi:MAG: RNA polymerase sigma-70 factor [Pedobacter sp.]|jgi:RNA polymerase sigma-70 factor (family 1)|uniref:RNA polymerase sigma factor n=1 Tax=Pedobacter sp. TaxID=1411316 RepID=UPI00356320A4
MVSLSEHSENELAGLLKTGSEAAFSEIYNRYWDKLYVVARKRLDSTFEGEEIVQEIFCNLWRKREIFQLDKGFNNYFSVAVKFEVINRLQKRERIQNLERNLSIQLTEFDDTTAKQVDFNELKAQIELTVRQLPEKCQIVFRLKHEDGLSQKQIADQLNVSEKTVEAHLSKARKTIKDQFGSLGSLFFLIFL